MQKGAHFLQKSLNFCRDFIFLQKYKISAERGTFLQISVEKKSTDFYRKVPLSAEICKFLFLQKSAESCILPVEICRFCIKINLQISAERGTFLQISVEKKSTDLCREGYTFLQISFLQISAERGTPFCRNLQGYTFLQISFSAESYTLSAEICRFLFLQKSVPFLQRGTPLSVDFCRKEIYRSLQRGVHLSVEIYRMQKSTDFCRDVRCKAFCRSLQILRCNTKASTPHCGGDTQHYTVLNQRRTAILL